MLAIGIVQRPIRSELNIYRNLVDFFSGIFENAFRESSNDWLP